MIANILSKREDSLTLSLLFLTGFMPIVGIFFAKTYAYAPAALALVFYLALRFWSGVRPKIALEPLWLILAILGLGSLSLLWTQDFELSSEKVLKLALQLPPQILVISVLAGLTPDLVKRYWYFIPIGTVIGSLLLFYDYLHHGAIFLSVREENYPNFRIADLNRGAATLSLFVFIAYPLCKMRMKPVYAFGLIFIPASMILLNCDSQSAALALLAGWFAMVAFRYQSALLIRILKYTTIFLMFAMPFVMLTRN